jgi:uncharacterized DUF497 family protein
MVRWLGGWVVRWWVVRGWKLEVGATDKEIILVVVHVDKEEVIRLISCRKATASERRRYEESKDE